MAFYIRKISGEKELFDIRKFRRSLKRAGADQRTISRLVRQLEKMPAMRNTKEIYAWALSQLEKESPPLAARYNLKHALLGLGPAGMPFEHFIAQLFEAQGYKTKVGSIIPGFCIDHEVDVVASKKDKHFMIECKFHNRQKLKSDVKVPLYIKSRFDDVEKAWDNDPQHGHEFHKAWIATNTKFTSMATEYAECTNITLLSWNYPAQGNLPDLIHKYDLHPITALTSLNRQQKKEFIKDGFVLCRDAHKHKDLLKRMGFTPRKIEKLVSEAQEVCKLGK